MDNLDKCVNEIIENGIAKNICVRVGIKDDIIIDKYYSQKNLNENTLYDVASVTKMIVTATLIHIAKTKKLLDYENTLCQYFKTTEDKKNITIANLLTHTAGIKGGFFQNSSLNYDNVGDFIISQPLEFPVGKKVEYVCQGYMLLGKILEKVFGSRLDELFKKYIADPLGMNDSTFLPSENQAFVDCNYRGEAYEVNDFNCHLLGGIAGNAGLFSNMNDVTKYVKMLLFYGKPLINEDVFKYAIKNHTVNLNMGKGLGFNIVDKNYTQTGRLFDIGSFGHCGHTGQSVYVHPESGLFAIILTDATGTLAKRDINYVHDYTAVCREYDVVCKMREMIHNAISEDINKIAIR